jgi:ribonuclease P protein component
MIAIQSNFSFFTIHFFIIICLLSKKEKGSRAEKPSVNEGKSFVSYPVRFVWVKMEAPLSDFPLQMALTVPKRSFPKAVDRNRLRRRIREAYRLNKHSIYQKLDLPEEQYGVMLIYIARETLDFHQIEEGVKKGLRKLPHRL